MDDFCTMLWSGMLAFHWKLSKEGRKRFFNEFLPLLHDTKHEVLDKDDDNSWYLVYIGTKTASRGKGYARALIEYTTKQVRPHRQSALFAYEVFGAPFLTVQSIHFRGLRGTDVESPFRPIRKAASAISNLATRAI